MEEGRDHFESENYGTEQNMSVESEHPVEEHNQIINSGEEDLEEESLILSSNHFKYNEEEFKKENVIKILMDNTIFKNKSICDICDHSMNLVNIKNRIDAKIWRCLKRD